MKKTTKREKFEMLLQITEVAENSTLVEFINHELELLAKKNASSTGNRKPTKTQMENDKLLQDITDYFVEVATEPQTITDLQTNIDSLQELSNQKVSALLKKLVDSQILVKFVEKKKTYFTVPTEQE